MRASPDDAAAVLLDGLHRRDARRAKRRRRAEEQRRHDGDGARERQHPPVEREIEEHGVGLRRQLAHEELAAPARDQQPERGADRRQQEAFRQQLTHQPPPRRAERQAHAPLVTPRGRARQQQVGDVGARDQQHERDHDHDRHERLLVAAAELRVAGAGGDTQRERLLQVLPRHPSASSRRAASHRGSAAAARGAPPFAASIDWPGLSRTITVSHHLERWSSDDSLPRESAARRRSGWRRRTRGRRRAEEIRAASRR